MVKIGTSKDKFIKRCICFKRKWYFIKASKESWKRVVTWSWETNDWGCHRSVELRVWSSCCKRSCSQKESSNWYFETNEWKR